MEKEFENSFDRTSKIDLAIDEIYEFIENCKMQAFSATKVIVPKDEMYELIDELRRKTPEEVGRCRKMLKNRNEIIQDAQDKAATILEDAREQYNAMVQEHVIVQEAIAEAQKVRAQAEAETNQLIQDVNEEAARILREAQDSANQIYTGAVAYTDDMLNMLQTIMEKTMHDAQNEYSSLIRSLTSNLSIVQQNRAELRPQEADMSQHDVPEKDGTAQAEAMEAETPEAAQTEEVTATTKEAVPTTEAEPEQSPEKPAEKSQPEEPEKNQ